MANEMLNETTSGIANEAVVEEVSTTNPSTPSKYKSIADLELVSEGDKNDTTIIERNGKLYRKVIGDNESATSDNTTSENPPRNVFYYANYFGDTSSAHNYYQSETASDGTVLYYGLGFDMPPWEEKGTIEDYFNSHNNTVKVYMDDVMYEMKVTKIPIMKNSFYTYRYILSSPFAVINPDDFVNDSSEIYINNNHLFGICENTRDTIPFAISFVEYKYDKKLSICCISSFIQYKNIKMLFENVEPKEKVYKSDYFAVKGEEGYIDNVYRYNFVGYEFKDIEIDLVDGKGEIGESLNFSYRYNGKDSNNNTSSSQTYYIQRVEFLMDGRWVNFQQSSNFIPLDKIDYSQPVYHNSSDNLYLNFSYFAIYNEDGKAIVKPSASYFPTYNCKIRMSLLRFECNYNTRKIPKNLIETDTSDGKVGFKFSNGGEAFNNPANFDCENPNSYSDNIATGYNSHAEGYNTTASGSYSHSEGQETTASGVSSHAEGNRTEATGYYSHAEGQNTYATGSQSHAEGYSTHANGYCSSSHGFLTTASGSNQFVIGCKNIEDTENKYIFIIGNSGGFSSSPSNAHTLDWDGNAWYEGKVSAGTPTYPANPTADNDLVTLAYLNQKIAELEEKIAALAPANPA